MKKFVLALSIMIICTVSAFTSFATTFKNPPITDNAKYLTETQFNELSDQLEKIRKQYNFDVSIYTEDVMSGEDAMSTADDIYDYNGYGANGAHGMMLYVSTNPRNYWFTTYGNGESFFNKNGLDYMENKILPYLKEDDYYSAFKAYVKYSDELLDMAAKGKPFDKKQHEPSFVIGVIVAALVLPLVVAFIFMRSKLAQMKTAVKENYASNYIKPGSMKLDSSKDIFLYSTVIKTEKPKSDSSSESHTSSSGRSHGGSGGGY